MTRSEHPERTAPGAPGDFVVSGQNSAKFVNLTAHHVKLMREKGPALELPPAAIPARVAFGKVGSFLGVDIVARIGEVEGLPGRELNTLYVTSRMVKDAVPDREDVVVPDMLVRNHMGEVIGARRVAQ